MSDWRITCTHYCTQSQNQVTKGAPNPMKPPDDDEVLTLARDIEDYLAAHPRATDSLEGITKWWLARHHYERAYESVQAALDYLVWKQVVSKQVTAGKAVYAYAPKRTN